MKLGIATNNKSASEPQWTPFDMEGYEANTREPEDKQISFLVQPQTRSLVQRVEKEAENEKKRSKQAFRGSRKLDGAELPDVGSNPSEDAFSRRLARHLVQDWKNVADKDTGEDLECNDTNKIWLFENIDIAVWVIEKAKALAGTALEDDEGNSAS